MTSVQPDPSAPVTTSPTPTPTGATPTAIDPYQVRIPDNDPRPWARGKTAAEILGIGDQTIGALQQVAYQQQQAQQVVPPVNPIAQMNKDDVVTVEMMQQYAQTLVPRDNRPGQQLAQLAYERVSTEPKYADVFARYPVEINNHLRQMPADLWTLDNIRLVGNLVRGEHIDELADAKAQQKLQGMQGLPIRGNSLGSAQVDSDGLPANYQDTLSRIGASLSQVDGFCVANGWTKNGQPDRKRWFEFYAEKPTTMGSRT